MKLIIDTESQILTVTEGDCRQVFPLYAREAFEIISRQWLRVGWSLNYYLTFTWLGRPVVQIPEDLVRLQEVICQIRPDFIVETGVYKGGSLLFHASLCEVLGKGHVVGIDIHIDALLREDLLRHPLGARISLVEGNSSSSAVFAEVAGLIPPGAVTLVLLDSSHRRDHVRAELELYSALVTSGSYIAVADGLMRDLTDVPGGQLDWSTDNPLAAIEDFLEKHAEFERVTPPRLFCQSDLRENITHWPEGWLRRKS